MTAFDLAEQMRPKPFDLIGTWAIKRGLAHRRDIGRDKIIIKRPHGHIGTFDMMPDSLPLLVNDGGGYQLMRLAR